MFDFIQKCMKIILNDLHALLHVVHVYYTQLLNNFVEDDRWIIFENRFILTSFGNEIYNGLEIIKCFQIKYVLNSVWCNLFAILYITKYMFFFSLVQLRSVVIQIFPNRFSSLFLLDFFFYLMFPVSSSFLCNNVFIWLSIDQFCLRFYLAWR